MKLWRHLKRCATFANYAGEPILDSQLRDAALLVINRSRAYNQAYLDFKREVNQTFTNVKRFFNLREADRMEVMDEAGEHGYGMCATSGDPLYDDAATRELREELTNLSSAIRGQETENYAAQQQQYQAQQMAARMQQLTDMQEKMQQMQQQMAMLNV